MGYECKKCSNIYEDKSELIAHKKRVHKPYVCDIFNCGKRFGRSAHLRSHKQTHNELRPKIKCINSFLSPLEYKFHAERCSNENFTSSLCRDKIENSASPNSLSQFASVVDAIPPANVTSVSNTALIESGVQPNQIQISDGILIEQDPGQQSSPNSNKNDDCFNDKIFTNISSAREHHSTDASVPDEMSVTPSVKKDDECKYS